MSIIGDLVEEAVDAALREILKKTVGTGKRARRRRGSAAPPPQGKRRVAAARRRGSKPAGAEANQPEAHGARQGKIPPAGGLKSPARLVSAGHRVYLRSFVSA